MQNLQGIILAGGISSRMGFPKALMPIGSSFFLLSVYDLLHQSGATPVHIVVNTGLQTSIRPQLNKFPDAAFHPNTEPAKGQMHSLRIALDAAAAAGAEHVIVALVDQPHIRAETVNTLLEHSEKSPGKIIAPRFNGHRGHPYLVPRACFDHFTNADGEKTAKEVLDVLADQVECVDVGDEAVVKDIDSMADLQTAKAGADDDLDLE